MKTNAKRRLMHGAAALCALLSTASALMLPASADEPYDVYNYNYLGEAVPSQAGYLAERSVSGLDLGTTPLSAPGDLFKDEKDQFYLVDSGNNRILKIDSEFTEVLEVFDRFTMPDGSETRLKNPKGVYVSPDTGLMYIADNENARALVAKPDGTVVMEITKPASTVYDQQLTFLPQKILCDNAGNIYIVLNNTTKGAAMFDANGEFIGYYGANAVAATATVIANHFWNAIASEEEKRYRSRSTPTAFDNFDIDTVKGFIYTSTSSGSTDTDIVKKVNPEGYNLFSYMSNYTWGDLFSTWYSGTTYKTKIVDIDIGDDGSINCLDATTGRVFQYDKEADLLFIMGATGDQVGAFTQGNVAAVETKGAGCENIYVLDAGKGTVTIFGQTVFGQIVHDATAKYNGGYYEEALEPWLEVVKRDGNYRRAYLGISSAYYNMGRYKESMEYAKKADASARYNRAFERYRSQWLREHLTQILLGVVLIIAGVMLLKYVVRKQKSKNQQAEPAQTGSGT
ncbi:MAG: hypothetical protein IKI45_05580 [Oscillospiraceae bacterium]|nr:hypothetical protein [Oscillospiraceae bacterium]